ncbi:MAG: hypothetical protein B7C24_01255 [Bacteroidetes bacterium 4572_77]|nr:MAG: hypothetical protein B7C24_01255 [Bacteroidetes bacterium 4572_77]
MTEDFLYYIWQYQLFETPLFTTNGEEIVLLKTGMQNTDSGPDFFNARLKIGDTIWAGNIEMHVKSSDWERHGHQNDKAYNNTILHVVFICDSLVQTQDQQKLKCLELKDIINIQLLKQYDYFLQNRNWIPCSHQLDEVRALTWNNWLERLMMERLEEKSAFVEEQLKNSKNHWEQAFFISIAGYFGQKINILPFQILARTIDLNIIAKHKNNLFQIEALLFGQAGMLQIDCKEIYHKELKKEYEFLSAKYQLTPMPYHLWKYMRLRPAAFPDIRIAQMAQLLNKTEFLFSKILEISKLDQLQELFKVEASSFWDTHYRFDVNSPKRKKRLGESSRNGLLINAIIPYLFVYGKNQAKNEYIDRSLHLLSQMKAEKNHITKGFTKHGKAAKNALESQAQIQLKQHYCQLKKCLNCPVGFELLGGQ